MRRRHSARRAVLFLAVLAQASTAAAQAVETIEPPSWWVERDEQGLLLLIEGSGLDGAEVRVAHGPIKVARIEPGRQGHALFVDVTVPGKADASHCEFEIAAGGKTIRRPWELVPKPARHPEPFGPDDVLYLVMIDRFANGDPTNDEPASAGTGCSTAATPTPTTAATSPASAAGSPTWSTSASRRSGSPRSTDAATTWFAGEHRRHAAEDGRLPRLLRGRLLRHQPPVRLVARLSRAGGRGPSARPEGDPGPRPRPHRPEAPMGRPPADR